ncbi:MAG: hypothetical protein IJR87_00510 [Bacteroidaceae bacterium]|nr:hypothetical protein [Bacteroidaceae bacterium]
MNENVRYKLLIAVVMLGLCWSVTSCRDEEDEPVPVVTPDEDAPLQMMVVFAPGQLGDNGYADNVMAGINRLSQTYADGEPDSINVGFIATYDMDDLATAMKDWAATPTAPFHHNDFERRILVLTEPFLADMLHDTAPLLRPEDEVLLLKANEEDVEAVAERYGLSGRVHGLNISAAASARNYCSFMRLAVENMKQYGEDISLDSLCFFRLYDTQTVTYRDSIFETLQEEFGSTSTIITTSISDKVGAGIYSVEYGTNVIESAFNIANEMQRRYNESGTYFAFVDLGSGNAGWDYFLLGISILNSFSTLMLDVPEAIALGRFSIQRQFGEALLKWSSDWARTPTGGMPRQVTYCNRQYCDDDFSIIFE